MIQRIRILSFYAGFSTNIPSCDISITLRVKQLNMKQTATGNRNNKQPSIVPFSLYI